MTDSVILRTATRLLVGLMLVFSVFMLLRGHNEPGGGFIGGLIASTGMALYSMAFSSAEVRRALKIDPRRIAMIGLAAALTAGVLPAFQGLPFLTGLWWYPLGTPILFDIGVYLVVVGGVLTILLGAEEGR